MMKSGLMLEYFVTGFLKFLLEYIWVNFCKSVRVKLKKRIPINWLKSQLCRFSQICHKCPLTLSNAYKFSLSNAWRRGFFTLRNNYKHTKTWRYIGEISREELVWLKDGYVLPAFWKSDPVKEYEKSKSCVPYTGEHTTFSLRPFTSLEVCTLWVVSFKIWSSFLRKMKF